MTDISLRHPINYLCPTCGSKPGEKCIKIPSVEVMSRKYHVTREAVARKAQPTERNNRMRKHG